MFDKKYMTSFDVEVYCEAGFQILVKYNHKMIWLHVKEINYTPDDIKEVHVQTIEVETSVALWKGMLSTPQQILTGV